MEEKSESVASDSRRPSDTNRLIEYLPLHPTTDFSPFQDFEFDLAVQEFCRNKNNHIFHKSETQATKNGNSKSKQLQSYTSANAPFNKVTRSAKVIISGDVAVGKTCLVNRFGHDVYSNSYQTTIGVDFDLQKFQILGQQYVLQVSVNTSSMFYSLR